MKPIRTLIVDDELLARTRIRNLLRGRPEFMIVGECANGKQAVAAIKEQEPDLIFLDVQMPDLDGFGVLESIGEDRLPVIVFVTAYDQYTLRAFEVHALDYLLKPFDDERFEKTLEWAQAQFERGRFGQLTERMLALLEDFQSQSARPRSQKSPTETGYLGRLVIKSAGRVQFVKTADIDWIEAEGYYARLHIGGKSFLLRETMSGLEAQLDPALFLRIHRSTIVNVERIEELQSKSHGDGEVVLQDGTRLKLSRTYRDRWQPLLDA